MSKGVIYATRSCFRLPCNHPFIVAMLCILILLHRASPFVFSLLVSASPVLVCTFLLLGTLLSYGQLNVPEIDIEEKTAHETVSLRTGVSKGVAFSENDSLYVERYSESKTSEAEDSKLAEARVDGSTDDSAPSMGKRSVEIESDNEETRDNVLSGDRYRHKTEWNREGLIDLGIVGNHLVGSPKIKDEHLESETEKSEVDSFDSERVNVDSLGSPPRSPWRRVRLHDNDGERDDDDDGDDDADALDSDSDGAESSSPDASMADIMPMLDELHPLLDDETPQPIQISHGGSDAGSEISSKSSSSSSGSGGDDDDDTDNDVDIEVAEDDNDDGEDEEEVNDEKESGNKSVITWTEEDQKNLLDLGSSELERNQRLESLILRRRARKNLSMIPERNLIDFESNDFSFHITPITTMRQNPFDLPDVAHSSYSGLPPIPGSAPSILIPGRNPFDIPYDSNEEKHNLTNDGFQEEFVALQSREPFFRRNETFNVGPSTFSHGRQGVSRFKPFFVPDRSISEESNYSPYQRNSSELSDSKASSVPETESVDSVDNLEDLKFTEENKQESGEVFRSPENEEFCEETELITEREVTEKDSTHEADTVSKTEHVSADVGHGSQSSEEEKKESSELGELEKRDLLNENLQFQSPENQDQYEEEEESAVQHKQNNADSGSEDVELRYNDNSSSSSFTEATESFFTDTQGEGLSISEERRDDIAHERHLSTQASTGSTNLNVLSLVVDDFPHKEPIYDSSPSADRKKLSSSSISSDVHVEVDPSLPPVLVKRTVSFVDRESDDAPRNIEMLPEASDNCTAVEHEPQRKDIVNDVKSDHSGAHSRFQCERTETHQRYENEDASKSDSRDESRETSAYLLEENSRDHTTEVASSSSQQNNQVSDQSSEDGGSVQLEEEKHLMISEEEKRILVNLPAFNRQIRCPTEKEENIASPSSDAEVFHEANEKLISTPSADGGTPLFYDVVMHEPFKHLEEVQVPNTPVGSFEEQRDITSLTIPQLQLLHRDTPTGIYSPQSPDFASLTSSGSGEASSHVDLETIIEEVDEIKEIYDGMLSVLDSPSDIHIIQQGSASNASASADDVSQNLQDIPVISEVEVQSIVEGDSVRQLDVDDVASEIEARTVKDIDVEVTQFSEKDTKKPILSESIQSDAAIHETAGERSVAKTQNHSNKSVVSSIHDVQITEVRPIEDGASAHMQVKNGRNSADQIQHEENSREVKLTSESHAVEAMLQEDNPSKKVFDELLNPTMNVRSKADLPSSSVHMELCVKEISLIVSEKSVRKVRISHSTKSDKGKHSKSSSSSSSSSSESSSSEDSE